MRPAFASIAAAALTLSAPAAAQQRMTYNLFAVDSEDWHIYVGLVDFEYRGSQKSGPLVTYTFNKPSKQLFIWVHVEKAKGKATVDGCNQRMAEKVRAGAILGPDDGVLGTHGDALTAESSLRITQDVVQRHLFVCRARGRHYVITQVAKMRYQPTDRDRLYELADHVRIVDELNPNPAIF